jgi:Domain of unknown function (DUF2019)
MNRKSLQAMTVEELAQKFIGMALEQSHALLADETGTYNRLFDDMEGVEKELKNRNGDQRKVLLSYYDHGNTHVRLKAALATLAIDPDLARNALQNISDSDEYPEAASARSMMRALDEKTYIPT